MGKWTFLKDAYPALKPDSDYQAKLDAVLDAPAVPGQHPNGSRVRDLRDVELAARYNSVRKSKDECEALLAVIELEKEAITRLFIDRMEDAGETSKKFEDGTSLSISDEPYPIVKDQVVLLAWVKESGLESMLTLNYMTMASLCKERLQEGQALPPGIDVFMKSKLTRRGGKEKK